MHAGSTPSLSPANQQPRNQTPQSRWDPLVWLYGEAAQLTNTHATVLRGRPVNSLKQSLMRVLRKLCRQRHHQAPANQQKGQSLAQ
ncbi:hypothetical protein AALO_G00218240 [Alosa alosa]|uniref:Uncharacterized protein n=1 Tax=Alosa alosa TaxID=278164 RepID=A0AAV6FWA0_9TELE|nr:hypothetical protein AALO_G00218240 [Alosa alosa]